MVSVCLSFLTKYTKDIHFSQSQIGHSKTGILSRARVKKYNIRS